jgi:hypothetical protein
MSFSREQKLEPHTISRFCLSEIKEMELSGKKAMWSRKKGAILWSRKDGAIFGEQRKEQSLEQKGIGVQNEEIIFGAEKKVRLVFLDCKSQKLLAWVVNTIIGNRTL